MRWTRRSFLAAGAALPPTLAWADSGGDTYPLWQVTQGTASVYVFGDCGSPTNPWASPRISKALASSQVFWKETPDFTEHDLARAEARGEDRNAPLSTWLTPQQKDRVTKAAIALGTTYERLQYCQPWLAAGILNQAAAAKQPPSSDPITLLAADAVKQHKTIHTEFPTMDALIDWQVKAPAAAQSQYLMFTIDTVLADPGDWPRRQAVWASGDTGREADRVHIEMTHYHDAYVAQTQSRNEAWPARFTDMLAARNTSFVAVGADHLVGSQSLFVQLGKAGMKAKRV
jgi:hypothetical protein